MRTNLLCLLLCATMFYTFVQTEKVQNKDLIDQPISEEMALEIIEKAAFSAVEPYINKSHEQVATTVKNNPEAFVGVPATCFSPDTDPAVVDAFYRNRNALQNSLGISDKGENNRFNLASRWSSTATDGGGLSQGDVTTITWSYVPDGTPIGNGGCGVPDQGTFSSDFISFFNGIYGPPTIPGDYTTAPWHTVFVDMFNSWSSVSGLIFVYEPNDDGSTVVTNPGVLGVRGDMRISGHLIDGNSNVLACNYYPNSGDMIIDTGDNFFNNNPGTGTINVLTHEVGHGLGIQHVCPVNQTKLMEPFISFAFSGPQQDDILATNRHYGDPDGVNNTSGTATFLGANTPPTSYSKSQRSIDDNGDVDYFSFSVNQASTLSVNLTPTGTTYLNGTQNTNGSCSSGSAFNALTVANLMVEVLDTDGSTVMATGSSNGPGIAESVSGVNLPSSGTYFVRVRQQGASVNNTQMYDLDVGLTGGGGGNLPPTAVCTNYTAQLNTAGTVTIAAADVDGGSSDPEGAVSLSVSPSSFTCSDIGNNTVTLTVTDSNGQTDTCTATVTIQDNILPNAVCQNITVQLDANGNVSIPAGTINNGSSDNCGTPSVSVSPNTFSCADVGANTVTLTATDDAGNIDTCTATVTVQDTVLPTVICKDITVQLDASCSITISPADIDDGSNDACGIDTMTISTSTFTCANVGPNTVSLIVTDMNGNTGTCTATVTVENILGIDDPMESLSTISIFPNPANDVITINNPQLVVLENILIYDMAGRIVATHDARNTGTETTINISMLQSANYFVVIQSKEGQINKRLIKN